MFRKTVKGFVVALASSILFCEGYSEYTTYSSTQGPPSPPVCHINSLQSKNVLSLTRRIETVKENSSDGSNLKHLKIDVVLADTTKPVIQCFFDDKSAPYNFSRKPTTRNLYSWLNDIAQRHQHNQLHKGTAEAILVSLRNCSATLLYVHDSAEAHRNEVMLRKVLQHWYPLLCGHIVNTSSSQQLKAAYGILDRTAIALLRRFRGRQEIVHVPAHMISSEEHVNFYVLSFLLPMKRITYDRVESELLQTEQGFVPALVVFYAHWCNGVEAYLEAMVRTAALLSEKAATFRTASIDLTSQSAVLLLLKKFNPLRYPFTLLFYPRYDGHRVVEIIYEEIVVQRPTPASVLDALIQKPVFLESSKFEPKYYQPWGWIDGQVTQWLEGPYGTQCLVTGSNQTDSEASIAMHSPSSQRTKPETKNWSTYYEGMPGFLPNIHTKLKRLLNIPILTEQYWDDIMETSRVELRPSGFTLQHMDAVQTAVVVFIRANCRSCASNMQTFDTLARSAKMKELRTAVYLVNCSMSTHLCSRLDIRGYPSVIAFRLLRWLELHKCLSNQTAARLRNGLVEYHGPLRVESLLQWLTVSSASAVNDTRLRTLNPLHGAEDNVILVATLMPKDPRFLPFDRSRTRHDNYLSHSCFNLVCEMLYGQAKCLTMYSTAVPSAAFTDNKPIQRMVVSQVDLIRADGFKTSIVEIKKPLLLLLKEQMSQTPHGYHSSHRYNLEERVKCEDDPSLCVDYIVQFTQDHGRLPVTHMTPEKFHLRSGLIGDHNLPVLITLMHADNITFGSKFSQMLHQAAVTFYESIRVVTIDVGLYPAWTSQFVPLDNSMNLRHDSLSALYRYPRFCLVNWTDHTRAAFFPPMSSENKSAQVFLESDYLTYEGIAGFVKNFINDPDVMLVPTERF